MQLCLKNLKKDARKYVKEKKEKVDLDHVEYAREIVEK